MRSRFFFQSLFLSLFIAVSIFPAQALFAEPTVSFSKVLKGSSPEYVAVQIEASGAATYDSHKLSDPASPRHFQVSAATVAKILALAQSLNYFRGEDLEYRHKVADMGLKTLTYRDGSQTGQVKFNYTENRSAGQLTEIFEKISNVEERIAQLESAMKYDPLSLPQILLQMQVEMGQGYYIEPALMIPTLDKILSDSRYLHLAQTRARELEARIDAK